MKWYFTSQDNTFCFQLISIRVNYSWQEIRQLTINHYFLNYFHALSLRRTLKGFFQNMFKGPPNLEKSSAYKLVLLNYSKIWISSMCSTSKWQKKNQFLVKRYFLKFYCFSWKELRPCSIRSRDLWLVGRSNIQCATEIDTKFWRYKLVHIMRQNRHVVTYMYCHSRVSRILKWSWPILNLLISFWRRVTYKNIVKHPNLKVMGILFPK